MPETIQRYEPINNESSYERALFYVAEQAAHLAETVLKQSLPLDTLTIFAQSDDEYETIEQIIRKRGKESPFTHEPTLYIETDHEVGGRHIKLLGVRRPDPERAERGYGDYPVDNFDKLVASLKGNPHAEFMRSGQDIALIKLTHPDFDVRGYIVSKNV